MKKWEYKSGTLHTRLLTFTEWGSVVETPLNDLGKEGWEVELVSRVDDLIFLATVLLKREAVPSYKNERIYLFVGNSPIGEPSGYLRYVDDWRGTAVQFARTLNTLVEVLSATGESIETITKDDVPF